MSKQILRILCFIIALHITYSQKLEKRLSPIQVEKEELKLNTISPVESPNTFKSIKDSLQGKVIEIHQEVETLSPVDSVNYDSLDDIQYVDDESHDTPIIRGKKNIKQWDHWGKWSDCSVTCGVGKTTRWRHCVSPGCASGEKEAQIKTCTMKPCP